MIEFKLPVLGENIEQGDLVRLMIAPGATVSEGQTVMELETDKAVIEVPSSVSGTIKEILVKEGDKIKVGQVVFTADSNGASAAAVAQPPHQVEPSPKRAAAPPAKRPSGEQAAAAAKLQPSSLVQPPSQPLSQSAAPPARAAAAGEFRLQEPRLAFQAAIRAEGKTEEQALPPDQPRPRPAAFSMPAQLGKVAGTEHREAVPAAPHTRRLARELGVDIYEVKGAGPGGRIREDDVKAHAKALLTAVVSAAQTPPRAGHFVEPKLPDFAKWGKIERVSMRGVRRKTAEHLAESWNTIPHVTQHDRADITELEQLRARFAPKAEQAGGKMTVTAIALKVCAAALKVFPQFNASIDMEKTEIVYKQYIHIGVAADTDRGLLVPVIRDVDKKNIVELAVELSQLSQKARDKKITLADMEGGSFTITNLGGIGGTAFTPIVNHPEVAILGLSRSRIEPEWIGGKFEPRLILPLSLSYDHRLIDGADAARFLRWVAEAFEQPFLLSVQG